MKAKEQKLFMSSKHEYIYTQILCIFYTSTLKELTTYLNVCVCTIVAEEIEQQRLKPMQSEIAESSALGR